ncbi:MAG: hypothetical protein C0407_04400 [Desulfobacca sp.]|nr:hypothetical protein [Desulfobacca sp.]
MESCEFRVGRFGFINPPLDPEPFLQYFKIPAGSGYHPRPPDRRDVFRKDNSSKRTQKKITLSIKNPPLLSD